MCGSFAATIEVFERLRRQKQHDLKFLDPPLDLGLHFFTTLDAQKSYINLFLDLEASNLWTSRSLGLYISRTQDLSSGPQDL